MKQSPEARRARQREYMRKYIAKNRDQLNAARREERRVDGDRIRAMQRAKYVRNKAKIRKQQNDAWALNRALMNRKQNARRYGLPLHEYDFLMAQSCGICGSRESLHIDHCHTTKRVRGVLCARCNTGIGLFRESIWFLGKAIQYLEIDLKARALMPRDRAA